MCMCAPQCEVNGEGEVMLSAGRRSRRGNLPRQTNQRGGDLGQRRGEGGGLGWNPKLQVTSSGDER